MNIMVIEDDPELMKSLCRLLADEGYTTLQAKDEREAEQVVSENGNNISVAIIDMRVPPKKKGLDEKESGLRIIKYLASNWPDIISIVHTGFETFSDAMKSVEAGATQYLVKGDDPDLVLKIVARNAKKWHKRKIINDTIRRIVDSLPMLVDDLEKMDTCIRNVRGSCERIRDEMQYIERNGGTPV